MDLPEKNHILRHVPYRKLLTDLDGNVLGILPQAFELREKERGLSVNWVEYFDLDTQEENIEEVVLSLQQSRRISPNSRFAMGNVKKVIDICAENRADKVKVVHDKNKSNPSHSLIIRIPRDDLDLREALAASAFDTLLHPASD